MCVTLAEGEGDYLRFAQEEVEEYQDMYDSEPDPKGLIILEEAKEILRDAQEDHDEAVAKGLKKKATLPAGVVLKRKPQASRFRTVN